MRTKDEMFGIIRESLNQYGFSNKDGSEIRDEQILEIGELFNSGFVLLVGEFQKMTEAVTVVVASVGKNIDKLGLIVSEESRKKNEN